MDDLRCENCGASITYSGRGRPPTRFCSRKCKDAARAQYQRARAVVARGERKCLTCGGIIPGEVTLRAKCCSAKCDEQWQNAKRAAAKRDAWRAKGLLCERCGKPIPMPDSGAHRIKYCSLKCKQLEMGARWRVRSPHYNRLYNYGITQEQYEAMWAAQGGICAICGTSEWMGNGKRPHTDHDHVTGKFRGILCGNCNNGLGMFSEDPARLLAAVKYLEAWLSRP